MLKRLSLACLAALLLVVGVAPVGVAKGHLVELGTDPAGDGPPALDVTYLQVGKAGKNLEIRIGIDKMLPVTGGYPDAPGIEWIFKVKKRVFIAEAVAGTFSPAFYLFEEKDGTFTQLANPEGTYDPADGYASILVPLKTIGAKSGVTIAGVRDQGRVDVDAHVHAGPATHYADEMQTTKAYVVP